MEQLVPPRNAHASLRVTTAFLYSTKTKQRQAVDIVVGRGTHFALYVNTLSAAVHMSRDQLREFNLYDSLRLIYKKGPSDNNPSYRIQLHMSDARLFHTWKGGSEGTISYNEFLNIVASASSTTYDAAQRLQALRRTAFNSGYITKIFPIEPSEVAVSILDGLQKLQVAWEGNPNKYQVKHVS
jgi:hypothetical protein